MALSETGTLEQSPRRANEANVLDNPRACIGARAMQPCKMLCLAETGSLRIHDVNIFAFPSPNFLTLRPGRRKLRPKESKDMTGQLRCSSLTDSAS